MSLSVSMPLIKCYITVTSPSLPLYRQCEDRLVDGLDASILGLYCESMAPPGVKHSPQLGPSSSFQSRGRGYRTTSGP